MGSKAGIWIDHRQAIVVTITPNGADLHRIMSNVETQPRREGDSPLAGRYEPLQVAPDDRQMRSVNAHLTAYYDSVADHIRDAESIFIFGPGAAKGELKKHMETRDLGNRIVGIETVDKMTDPQIEAMVKQHFAGKASREGSNS